MSSIHEDGRQLARKSEIAPPPPWASIAGTILLESLEGIATYGDTENLAATLALIGHIAPRDPEGIERYVYAVDALGANYPGLNISVGIPVPYIRALLKPELLPNTIPDTFERMRKEFRTEYHLLVSTVGAIDHPGITPHLKAIIRDVMAEHWGDWYVDQEGKEDMSRLMHLIMNQPKERQQELLIYAFKLEFNMPQALTGEKNATVHMRNKFIQALLSLREDALDELIINNTKHLMHTTNMDYEEHRGSFIHNMLVSLTPTGTRQSEILFRGILTMMSDNTGYKLREQTLALLPITIRNHVGKLVDALKQDESVWPLDKDLCRAAVTLCNGYDADGSAAATLNQIARHDKNPKRRAIAGQILSAKRKGRFNLPDRTETTLPEYEAFRPPVWNYHPKFLAAYALASEAPSAIPMLLDRFSYSGPIKEGILVALMETAYRNGFHRSSTTPQLPVGEPTALPPNTPSEDLIESVRATHPK